MSPGQNTGSFSLTTLTVGTGRGTVHGTRVGADVRPGLGNTPGSENWTWVLDAVKPVGSELEPGIRKVLAVVVVAAGVVKPVLAVVDIESPEKHALPKIELAEKNHVGVTNYICCSEKKYGRREVY